MTQLQTGRFRRRASTVLVVAGLALMMSINAARSSGEGDVAPLLTGWMQGFVPAEKPRPAPEAAFIARDGSERRLADFRGRLVLVNLWATWCPPCIREMPALTRLQTRLGGDDFTVLALSQDFQGWRVMAPFIEKHDLATLPIYHDPKGKFARGMRTQGLPTTVLFDRQGRELGRLVGAAEWDSPETIALLRHYMAAKSGR
jgi:thiol-disulfide isomerase/thioredoxin